MSALEAARMGDEIGHSSALGGLLLGVLAGIALAVAIVAIVGTGGVAAVAIGAGIAAAGAGGGLAGKSIGEVLPGRKCGPIETGSHNVDIERLPAARAGVDVVEHDDDKVAQGSATVFVNQRMLARRTDKSECGGKVKKACRTVFVGGETATAEGMKIREEVPPWLVTTLKVVAIAGTVVATGGVGLAVGWGAALGGLGGGMLAGTGLGWVGGEVGGYFGGEVGARIGEVVGSTIGGIFGGIAGARMGSTLTGRPLTGGRRVGGSEEIPVTYRDGTRAKFQALRKPMVHKVYDVEVYSPLVRQPGAPPPVTAPKAPSAGTPVYQKSPYYSQEETLSCGMACSRMVIATKKGVDIPEGVLRDQSAAMGGYSPRNGTRMNKVAELLNANEVPASHQNASFETLAARASSNNPAIAEMKGHVVVVDGVYQDPRYGTVVSIRDPNGRIGKNVIEAGAFQERYEGTAIFTDR